MGRSETSMVNLVGQLLACEFKGCKIRRIRLGDASGEYRLKLDDRARVTLLKAALNQDIQVGDWVQVLASRKVKLPKSHKVLPSEVLPPACLALKVKLKVRDIERINPPAQPDQQTDLEADLCPELLLDGAEQRGGASTSTNPSSASGTSSKVKVLVCQKSGCCKRGGKAMYKTLTKTVEKEGLGDRICIKATGCLGKCSKGPNIVVNKTRHHYMAPETVPPLLANYL